MGKGAMAPLGPIVARPCSDIINFVIEVVYDCFCNGIKAAN